MSLYQQILGQPQRLRALLEDLGRSDHPLRSTACASLLRGRRIILTGMGSSLYACYPAQLRLARAGFDVGLWETAELVHFAMETITPGAVVIAVSQSGETAEMLALLDRLPSSQPVLAVTNVPESTLGRRASFVLELQAERSCTVATQTYLNTVALLVAVAYAACSEDLSQLLADLDAAAAALELTLAQSLARSDINIGRDGHLVFLARGPSLASAHQVALMFHEVAVRGAAAMSSAAFRHGPLEMAGPSLQACVFLPQGPTAALMESLAVELERFGARVLRIADSRLGRGDFVHPPVDEELAPLVNIAPVQVLAYRAALALGREPGVFLQGQSVTRNE